MLLGEISVIVLRNRHYLPLFRLQIPQLLQRKNKQIVLNWFIEDKRLYQLPHFILNLAYF